MISKLPAEVILTSCEFLSFSQMNQLAWTNKRFMKLILKNYPMAIMPSLYHIAGVAFDPLSFNEGKYDNIMMTIKLDIIPVEYSPIVKTQAIIRDFTERRQFESIDKRVRRAFNWYFYYCFDEGKEAHDEDRAPDYMTWEKFAVDIAHLASNETEVPPIELGWFFAKSDVDRLICDGYNNQQMWNLMKMLDSIRATPSFQGLFYPQLPYSRLDEDDEIPINIMKTTPPYNASEAALKLLRNAPFHSSSPDLQMEYVTPYESSDIFYRTGGLCSFHRFFKNLLQVKPFIYNWMFQLVHNTDMASCYDTVVRLLSVLEGISWIAISSAGPMKIFKIILPTQIWHLRIIQFNNNEFDLRINDVNFSMENLAARYKLLDKKDGTGRSAEESVRMDELRIKKFGKTREEKQKIKYDAEKWTKM